MHEGDVTYRNLFEASGELFRYTNIGRIAVILRKIPPFCISVSCPGILAPPEQNSCTKYFTKVPHGAVRGILSELHRTPTDNMRN